MTQPGVIATVTTMREISPMRAYAGLALLTALTVAVVGAVGYFPTINVGGRAAIWAMLVGLLIGAVATLVGLIPVMASLPKPPRVRHNALLFGMTIRMVATILLTAAVALSGQIAVKPLLIWVAISYVMLLGVDTSAVAWLYKRLEREA